MSNEIKCHWCSNYGASTFSYKENGKKYVSTQKFCSRKCEAEYDDKYGVDYKQEPGGCFVATAVYGNYDHPVVLDLRYFRDHFLDQKKWGRSFIKWYYTYSPKWANIISRNRVLRMTALIIVVKPLHFFAKLVRKKKNDSSFL